MCFVQDSRAEQTKTWEWVSMWITHVMLTEQVCIGIHVEAADALNGAIATHTCSTRKSAVWPDHAAYRHWLLLHVQS